MANPVFTMLGGGKGNPMLNQFMQFMSKMQGQNPDAILQQMISSGQINQQQLNMVQTKAKEMETMFDGIKDNFGF